ncbi:collagenase [Pseudoalteromonas sp. MSK9-3]|nr:collagenase [Pseudoalteromonas sp. MSK9-3]
MLFNFKGLCSLSRQNIHGHNYKKSYLMMLLAGMSSACAFAGEVAESKSFKNQMMPLQSSVSAESGLFNKASSGQICGTDTNLQNWDLLQKENAREALLPSSLTSQIQQRMAQVSDDAALNGNGVAGRYYIPVVVHVYGDRYNCETGTYCLTEQKIIEGLNKTNEDFRGLITDDGPISAQFQAIRENLDIEFVLAKKDPSGNVTNGIVRHAEKAGYGDGEKADAQIAADAWDNFKYMNIYIQHDLYADGKTNNSGVAWYPQVSMSDAGLARVVYNGDYVGANTNENFRSVLTHEFGHWLNLPHTFDGEICTVHSQAFCSATGDGSCDTPQMSSSILQNNAQNCLGEATNTENFMHYSDNYAMYTQDQVKRMTAALHSAARATLWSNNNLIAVGLEELTSNADHPWDGIGGNPKPQGTTIKTFNNISAQKGEVDNFEMTVPAGTEAVAFYLDGYDEDPDMYVSKGTVPTKTGDNWNADFISFRSAGSPELVTVSSPSSTEVYHAAVDAFSSYSNATLSVISAQDSTLCNGCERVFLTEVKDLASAKGAPVKTYQYQIPTNAVRTVAVIPGGYQGDPDAYMSMNATPDKTTYDCGPFSAPRLSEYCEFGAGGGTLNIMIDPFLEYSGASLVVYYERQAGSGLPVAKANGDYSALIGQDISFSSAGSNDTDGSITSYLWAFGDGATSTLADPTHNYQSAGNYNASLQVTDNDGNTATDSANVMVSASNQAPVANANGPYAVELGEAITFSSAGSSDPDGTITAYAWAFGDGQTSTSANPIHTYTAAGNYSTTLTVTDNLGLTNASTAQVTVSESSYCEASGNTRYEWIANVQSGSFTNPSQGVGYQDFTSKVIELTEGNNTLTLTPGGTYTEHWTAWLDSNNDGTFSENEKVLTGASGKGAVSGQLTVPAGLVGQSLRLRVAMKYSSAANSACGNIGDGEVEDYTVLVKTGGTTPPVTVVPNACLTQSPITGGRLEAGTASCLGGNGTLWLSLADVSAAQSVAITTAHGQGNLEVFYKNGGWPSESDYDATSNSGTHTECIYVPAGTQHWSYLKINGDATNTSIIVDFDTASCRQ